MSDDWNYKLSNEKSKFGGPLDEIVLVSVHKFSFVMWRHDVIRELGNRCHAGLLYLLIENKFCKNLRLENGSSRLACSRAGVLYFLYLFYHFATEYKCWFFGQIKMATSINISTPYRLHLKFSQFQTFTGLKYYKSSVCNLLQTFCELFHFSFSKRDKIA